MIRRTVASLVVAVGCLFAACAPAAAPAPASTAPAAKPTPAAPAAATTAPAKPGTDAAAEWNRVLAAAKQEGKVVMSAQPSDVYRKALMTFEQDYPGISVEFTGIASRDFFPKLYLERGGGQYLWDLRVGGTGAEGFDARDRGVLESVRDVLLLPEVVDDSQWFGGTDGRYDDKDKQYLLSFQVNVAYGTSVNRDLIPQSEFNSVKQLVDPKWKGKITLRDPRGGGGLAHLSTYLQLYGEDFIRSFLSNQEVVVTNDARQQAEWLIRGRYPIGVGVSDGSMTDFRNEGLGGNVEEIREGGTLSTGVGGIQLFTRAPHPNAARVFINWLLTREVQERISPITQQNSRRLDVPVVDPSAAPDPKKPLSEYVSNQREEFLPVRDRAQQLAADLLK